jgi:hypothetical protein
MQVSCRLMLAQSAAWCSPSLQAQVAVLCRTCRHSSRCHPPCPATSILVWDLQGAYRLVLVLYQAISCCSACLMLLTASHPICCIVWAVHT